MTWYLPMLLLCLTLAPGQEAVWPPQEGAPAPEVVSALPPQQARDGEPHCMAAPLSTTEGGLPLEWWRTASFVLLAMLVAVVAARPLGRQLQRARARPPPRSVHLLEHLSGVEGLAARGSELALAFAGLNASLEASQAALEEARARQTAIVESAPDAIITVDAEGRVLEFNAAAERLFGQARTQVVGADVHRALLPQSEHATSRRLLEEARGGGQGVVGGEVSACDGAGRQLTLEVRVAHIPLQGPPLFALHLRDVTEQRRIELERSQFIGILGHDLRNPLAAITAGAGLLLRRGAGPAEARTLQRILTSAQRMARMIHDVLDFTRARAGQGLPLCPAAMDMGQACSEVLEELRSAFPERRLELEVAGEVAGHWDRDRACQVVSNLVGNALAYSPRDSAVRVRVCAVQEGVRVEVSNLGPPLPPELLPHLFEPFRRGVHPEGKGPRGLGLGLYIVQQIVQAHRGRVEVDSSAEAGTTFRVLWPHGGASQEGEAVGT